MTIKIGDRVTFTEAARHRQRIDAGEVGVVLPVCLAGNPGGLCLVYADGTREYKVLFECGAWDWLKEDELIRCDESEAT